MATNGPKPNCTSLHMCGLPSQDVCLSARTTVCLPEDLSVCRPVAALYCVTTTVITHLTFFVKFTLCVSCYSSVCSLQSTSDVKLESGSWCVAGRARDGKAEKERERVMESESDREWDVVWPFSMKDHWSNSARPAEKMSAQVWDSRERLALDRTT